MNHQASGIDFSGIRAANPIVDTVSRYIELRRRGSEYLGLCPFHNDKSPSFAVVDSKGKAFCNACHWHGDVIDFVAKYENVEISEAARRLAGHELPSDRPAPRPLPPDEAEQWTAILPAPVDAPAYDPAKTFNPRSFDKSSGTFGRAVNWAKIASRVDPYLDADGQRLGYVVRLDVDGQKMTPTVTWARHRDGRECWAAVKFPGKRPLQGLDALARRPDAAVLVVSGEKCRDAAASALTGFVAVTWAGGDGAVGKADWSPLAGRRVTLWPDADESGIDACRRLASILHPIAAEVRLITPTGQPKGWDIADAIQHDGWGKEEIIAWVKPRVSVWSPDQDAADDEEGEPDLMVEPSLPAARVNGSSHGGFISGPVNGNARPWEEEMADHYASFEPSFEPYFQTEPDYLPAPAKSSVTSLAGRLDELEQTVDATTDAIPSKYSEDNITLAFSVRYQHDLRYVHPWGRWLRWDGQRWVIEETLAVFDLARDMCRAASNAAMRDREMTPKQQESTRKQLGQASVTAAVERMARSDRRHAATVDQWDADPWALNTPAGVVDLRSGAIRPGDRQAHMTKITRVAPGGACPTWHHFLETSTGGDAELIAYLKRVCGYSLTGSTREHALFFVYGSGGNGKGTFLNTFQWIIGDYAKAAPADMFTERKNEAHTTELARLMGARLVTAQETEEGKRWAEAKIKMLTGGDTITARFMRQDDFEYVPQFKLVMTGNHKPGLRNVDEAIKRRLNLIPFTVNIPAEQRDKTLPDRLKDEAAGILQWAIEGCLEWQRDGLRPPPAVVAATAEYLEQQDVLGAWIDECCEQVPTISTSRGVLYKSFKAWSEAAGEYTLPQKRWLAAMEMRGFTSRVSRGSPQFTGLRLMDRQDDSQQNGDDPLF